MDWFPCGHVVVDYLRSLWDPSNKSAKGEMSLACEFSQMNLFDRGLNMSLGKPSGLCRDQKLNFFRLAQKIRDEHGTRRENSPLNCFQSFEDIVELEQEIKINNSMEFMLQCMRLDLVDDRHWSRMFWSTSTVEQLVALYEESVSMWERCMRMKHGKEKARTKFILGRRGFRMDFQDRFRNLMRAQQFKRPLWGDIKLYLERALCFKPSDVFTFDIDIPDADLDDALSCVLSNAELYHRADRTGELVNLSESLLSRGASLHHRDQHGVSSLMRLLDLGYALRTLSTYVCCPLKIDDESEKIIADNRRLAPLSCLAARSIVPSTIDDQLPSQLRLLVRSHQELRGLLTGRIPNLGPVDELRREMRRVRDN